MKIKVTILGVIRLKTTVAKPAGMTQELWCCLHEWVQVALLISVDTLFFCVIKNANSKQEIFHV